MRVKMMGSEEMKRKSDMSEREILRMVMEMKSVRMKNESEKMITQR